MEQRATSNPATERQAIGQGPSCLLRPPFAEPPFNPPVSTPTLSCALALPLNAPLAVSIEESELHHVGVVLPGIQRRGVLWCVPTRRCNSLGHSGRVNFGALQRAAIVDD